MERTNQRQEIYNKWENIFTLPLYIDEREPGSRDFYRIPNFQKLPCCQISPSIWSPYVLRRKRCTIFQATTGCFIFRNRNQNIMPNHTLACPLWIERKMITIANFFAKRSQPFRLFQEWLWNRKVIISVCFKRQRKMDGHIKQSGYIEPFIEQNT